MQPTRGRRSSFQFKLHQIIERNTSDNLQTFGADFIERVLRGMPWWKIEIDQIDDWNPDLIKRAMIVRDVPPEVGKMRALSESFSSSEDVTSQIDGRIGRQRYLERFIPDHIKQDTAAKILGGLMQLSREMTAAVKTIGGGKIFECFLAVEKGQLDFGRQGGIHRQNTRHFNEQAGTGATIVRPHKTNRVECFGVVMRAKKELRGFFLVPETRNQVYECRHPSWCRRGKLRPCCRPTD